MSYSYTLPDGSNDAPDEHGRHTATGSVMHSAAEFARFPGCEQCAGMARLQAQNDDIAAAGFWWSAEHGWRRFIRDSEGKRLRLADPKSYTWVEALAIARARKAFDTDA
jgi:hypothetical protein